MFPRIRGNLRYIPNYLLHFEIRILFIVFDIRRNGELEC